MRIDEMREEGITCNDCYFAMQNCHDRSICCEDETGLCSFFERAEGMAMNEEEKALIGRKIVKAEVSGYGITLTLDNGTAFIYFASDGGYSSYGIETIGADDEV